MLGRGVPGDLPPSTHLPGYMFIRAAGGQRIGSGQVDDFALGDFFGNVGEDALAGDFFDRHAGVVGDLLVEAGERIKERRLADVGVASESPTVKRLPNRQRDGDG